MGKSKEEIVEHIMEQGISSKEDAEKLAELILIFIDDNEDESEDEWQPEDFEDDYCL